MRHLASVLALPLFLSLAGCADLVDDEPKKPALTPLQIQSLQQRELETSKDIAFASVVSVFQDLGYTIESADLDTGFITAESLAKSDEEAGALELVLDILADEEDDYDVTTKQTRATAFVEQFGDDRAKVRLSFVKTKSRSGAGGQISKKDKQILDSEVYRNAFDRIETAVFVREGAGASGESS
ncbi:MAG: hypothetical protein AAGA21_06785 [Pseudomonadota bacterium]